MVTIPYIKDITVLVNVGQNVLSCHLVREKTNEGGYALTPEETVFISDCDEDADNDPIFDAAEKEAVDYLVSLGLTSV